MSADIRTELLDLAREAADGELGDEQLDRLVAGGITRGQELERAQRRRHRWTAAGIAAGVVLLVGAVAVPALRPDQAGPGAPAGQPSAGSPSSESSLPAADLGPKALAAVAELVPPGATMVPVEGAGRNPWQVVQRFTWTGPQGTSSGELTLQDTGGNFTPPGSVKVRTTGPHGITGSELVSSDGRGGRRMVTAVPLEGGFELVLAQWNRAAGAASPVSTPQLPWTAQQAAAALDQAALSRALAPVTQSLGTASTTAERAFESLAEPSHAPMLTPDDAEQAFRSALRGRSVKDLSLTSKNDHASFRLGKQAGLLGASVQPVTDESCATASWSTIACRDRMTDQGLGIAVVTDSGWPGAPGGRTATVVRDTPRRTTPAGDVAVVTRYIQQGLTPADLHASEASLDADLAVAASPALDPVVAVVGARLG